MNIIIAINEKYLEPAKTMLYSLACQQEEHLVVYLLQSTIRAEKLEEFREFIHTMCHGELEIVPIDRLLFANAPRQKWLSEETYYRLISFSLLPESVDRILWLDGDIIVKGNITELYQQDFEGNYAVACAEDTKKHHARLGLSEGHRYFNAGVVLYAFDAREEQIQFFQEHHFELAEHLCISKYLLSIVNSEKESTNPDFLRKLKAKRKRNLRKYAKRLNPNDEYDGWVLTQVFPKKCGFIGVLKH